VPMAPLAPIRHPNFCLYRRRNEPDCFVPDPNYFPRPQPCCIPVLVEPEQIGRMLALTNGMASVPVSPLRPAVIATGNRLAIHSGLRRSEVIRLALQDVEPQAGVLRICESKFHKSRLIPLSSGGLKELHRYLSQRMIPSFDSRPSSPLLCNFAKENCAHTPGPALAREFMLCSMQQWYVIMMAGDLAFMISATVLLCKP